MSNEKNPTNQNLAFWKSVETTPPSYTKEAKVSGQIRTAVDAQYKKMMITSKFGMYGIGWGVEPESERYERVHYENSTCILNYNAIAFYKQDGEIGRIPIAAQIKESYVTSGNSGYLKIDDEAMKKVRTDALTKAFTDLGFCADIHMGKFDDQDYVAGAKIAEAIAKEEEREAKAKEMYKEVKTWFDSQVESALTVSNPAQRIKALDRIKDKVITRCQAGGFASKGFETLIENEKEKLNASK